MHTHTDTSSTSNSVNEKPIFPLPLSELLLLSSQALACPAQSTGHDRKGSQVGLHLLQSLDVLPFLFLSSQAPSTNPRTHEVLH